MSPEQLQKTAEELNHYAVALANIAKQLGAGQGEKKKKKGLTPEQEQAFSEKFIRSLYK